MTSAAWSTSKGRKVCLLSGYCGVPGTQHWPEGSPYYFCKGWRYFAGTNTQKSARVSFLGLVQYYWSSFPICPHLYIHWMSSWKQESHGDGLLTARMHSQQRKRSSLKHPSLLILILLCLCDRPGMPLLMVLVLCSLICTMMALRGQLHMPHIPSHLVSKITLNWKKKLFPWCLALKSFIHTFMVMNSRCWPITSHSPPFWDPRQVSRRWLQLDCRAGHCCYHRSNTRYSTSPPSHTAMLLGYQDYQSKQTSHPTLNLCLPFSIFTRLQHCQWHLNR